MPIDTVIVMLAIATPFIIFAAALFWGELQTRELSQ
jgi:hypothetical protein